MTAQLLGARVIGQVIPAPVRPYWPALGLVSNLGTRSGVLPGCWYVEVNAGRWLLTVAGRGPLLAPEWSAVTDAALVLAAGGLAGVLLGLVLLLP